MHAYAQASEHVMFQTPKLIKFSCSRMRWNDLFVLLILEHTNMMFQVPVLIKFAEILHHTFVHRHAPLSIYPSFG